jgi:hypothetical protein
MDVAFVSRAGAKAVAARAHDADFVVSGMYGCLHGFLPFCTEPFDSKGWLQDSANGAARFKSPVGLHKPLTTKDTKYHKDLSRFLRVLDRQLLIDHN